MLEHLTAQDPELAAAVTDELTRQRNSIELIASENFVSLAVMEAVGSPLTNKYAEGLPAHRYYGGCWAVDVVENIARDRAKKLFGAAYANVQPHSGAQANYAATSVFAQPGDTIMGMDLSNGGHLTHGSPANYSGKLFNVISYGLNPETERIDYDDVAAKAAEYKPKLIIAGASAYPRVIDFEKFAQIAHDNGAALMVDMAHIAGLVAAGEHPSPIPYADVVTTTTHKTMRGPRGGIILTNDPEIAKKINSAVFPGTQGGPLMHIIAAKAIALGEALQPDFIEYQAQIVKNAKALAQSLLDGGLQLVSGGTDNHLLLIDLRNTELSGRDLEERLDRVRITVNKNKIPGDPRSAKETSGVRVGTPAVTTRGFKEEEMKVIGDLICRAVFDFDSSRGEILAAVDELCTRFPLYE